MADGAFTGEVFVAIARAVDQGTADGFGGDARVGERGLELGIGLGVGFDQVANVVSQLGVILFGGVSPALGVPIETGDPGAQFVEAELDGLSSPAEDAFGLTRVAVEVIASDLGLEPPPFGTGQEPGGLAKGLESVFRERFHGSPRLVKDTGRWTEEIGYGWPESRGRLFCSYRLKPDARGRDEFQPGGLPGAVDLIEDGSSGLKCEPRALSSSSDLEGSAMNHNLIHLIDSCRPKPNSDTGGEFYLTS